MAHTSKWLCILALLGGCADPKPDASRILEDMAQTKQAMRLSWDEKIDSTKFGFAANKNVDGKTLAQVITSQSAGRDDGQLCSACHNSTEAMGGYAVPAAQNAASPTLKPTDKVDNRTWVGTDGWAVRFINNPTKPANLKMFMQAWINNGYK